MRPRYPFLVAVTLVSALIALGQDPKQKLNDQLWEASRTGDVAVVTSLLDQGADVNAKFRYGTTALFKASERGHTAVVKVLLARGADPSVKDTFYGATAMTWALQNNHFEVVRALLEKDATGVGDVLTTGARQGKPELVEIALARGGANAETLTAALATTMNDKDKAAIAEMLRKAGATPPMELDAATLQQYVGRYKPDDRPNEIALSVKDGQLIATPMGQNGIRMMPTDKVSFRPVEFDGLTIVLTVEDNKATSFTLKQGQNTTVFKKIVEPKP
ncbi:MAG TPA: ankyrin repeat domain-containing protein [Pyrinomonadaceae bacterium]|nr:ankyrin repeat domain-containing protein [Pyrinomonadaceae bacterium]